MSCVKKKATVYCMHNDSSAYIEAMQRLFHHMIIYSVKLSCMTSALYYTVCDYTEQLVHFHRMKDIMFDAQGLLNSRFPHLLHN